jgi:hypothetical protein
MSGASRRRHQVRARRALLWGVALFCIAQLAAGLCFDWVCPQVRFPELPAKAGAISALPHSPDVLCLGGSRTRWAFQERVIEAAVRDTTGQDRFTVFNAAINNSDLVTMDYSLERFLRHAGRPAWVVVEVSPETLAERNFWLNHEIKRHWTWVDVATRFGEIARFSDVPRLLETRLVPLSFYRRSLLPQVHFPSDWSTPASIGKPVADVPRLEDEPDLRQPRPASASRHPSRQGLSTFRRWLKDYRVGGSATEALDRLVRRCRQGGMAVILLAPPLASEHRRLYTAEIEKAFLGHVRDLELQYGCLFADYRDCLPDAMFLDSHHVLREGGERFSRQFSDQVLSPLRLGKRPGSAIHTSDRVAGTGRLSSSHHRGRPTAPPQARD